jgi:PAS domain-containing protein
MGDAMKLALDAEEIETFRFLEEQLTIGHLFVKSETAEILYWGRGAQESYGYTEKEALGQVSHQLLKTVFPDSLHAVEFSISRTGEWQGELTHISKSACHITVGCHQKLHERPGGRSAIIVEVGAPISKDSEGWKLSRKPR